MQSRIVRRFALLVICLACACSGGGGGAPQDTLSPQAPNLQGVDLSGRPFHLSSFRGRTVLLVFWASWCSICTHDMQALKLLHRRLGAQGLAIVAVAIDDTAERAREFARRNELPFTVLVDNGLAKELYKVQALPDSYVINPQGRFKKVRDPETQAFTYQMSGPRDWGSKEAYMSLYEALQ